MVPDLPSSLLRSFVAVIDCVSLAAAAARIGRSESALSLQMSRLEDVVGQPLFERDGRALRLNQTGSLLLAHARTILGRIDAARAELGPAARPLFRIGVVQDFVGSVLRPTLGELQASNPGVSFNIVIGGTAELLQAMGEDRIDTALWASDLTGRDSPVVFPMGWFGASLSLDEEVIPLVTITPPCPFLAAAQHALDANSVAWRLAVITPSLDGVRAAVAAGLGVACRTGAGMGRPADHDDRLPDLPLIRYSVLERRHGKDGPGPIAATMMTHLRQLAAEDP